MYTNKSYKRLEMSREKWKNRATESSLDARRASQRANYHGRRHETLLKQVLALREENEDLRNALNRSAKAPVRVIPTSVLQILCIQLVINVHVSFRSVPRILALLCQHLGLMMWLPHYTTIIEWVLRIGLATVQSAGRIAEPWIGIIDFSILSGKEKVLVILRLPLSHFTLNQAAPRLENCETIAVSVRTNWDRSHLLDELRSVIKNCGQPVYWLTDGGKDLAAALRELPREGGSRRKPYHVLDIGHFFANALKHMFASRSDFIAFLSAVQNCASQIRQTEFSQLTPPRIRGKGRFQSLERLTDWFCGLREYLARQQRGTSTEFQTRMQKFFSWTDEFAGLADEFSQMVNLSNRLQGLLKTKGMNLATWPAVRSILGELPSAHPFRIEIEPYLRRCLNISNLLNGVPLVISDDVIETLFGLLKFFTGDGKNSNFGRMALAVPAMTGIIDQARIERSFSVVKSEDLRKYIKTKIPRTLLRRRRSDLRVGNIRRRRKGKKPAEIK